MKKIISAITAFVMLVVLCMPLSINVNAEENINIHEKYTMEEFLALSEEEVCSISEEIAEKYNKYKNEVSEYYSDYDDPDIVEWPIDRTEEDIAVPAVFLMITEELLNEIDDFYKELGDIEFYHSYMPKLFSASPEWWMGHVTHNFCGTDSVCSCYTEDYCAIELTTQFFNEESKVIDVYDISAKLAIWYTSLSGTLDFSFEYPAYDSSNQVVKFGDINTDGKISICDIIMLSKYNTGGVALNDYQKRCADCNNDGEVNDLDTYALMSYLVNLTDKLPYKS